MTDERAKTPDWTKYQRYELTLVIPDELFVKCTSFTPWSWELLERRYPNHLICVSRDWAAIEAAARLWKAEDSKGGG